MAIERVQRLRHEQIAANVFTGLQGELTIVIETNEIRSHDGSTAGGQRILTKTQNDALYQALNTELTALSSFASGTTGLVARVANGQYQLRTLTPPASGLSITNPDGVAGNPTFVLSGELAGIAGLAATGIVSRTGSGTYAARTITSSNSTLNVANGDGVGGAPTLSLAGDLASITGFGASGGIVAHTAAGTFTLRTIGSSSNNLVWSNGDGIAGAPSIGVALDLAVLSGFAAGTGIPARTAANTWALRAITGTANEITATNGDGVAGAPTLSLPAALTFTGKTVTGGTFNATALQVGGVNAVLTSRQILAGTGLSGGGDLSADRSLSLPNVGPGAAQYETCNITLDAQGRVSARVARNVVIFKDLKAAGTNGDALTLNTWTKRTITNKTVDTGGVVTLSASQFTYTGTTGTWEIKGAFSGFAPSSSSTFQTRLRDITATLTISLSTVGGCAGATSTITSMLMLDRVTLTNGHVYEFETWSDGNGALMGGAPGSSPGEQAEYLNVAMHQVA